jgi:hypothetical protein
MLTRSFQSSSPQIGFQLLALGLISFALTLFLVLVTAGNILRATDPALLNLALALFSLTPIFGWLELLNKVRTDGTLPIAWVEDLTTTIQRFWQTLK